MGIILGVGIPLVYVVVAIMTTVVFMRHFRWTDYTLGKTYYSEKYKMGHIDDDQVVGSFLAGLFWPIFLLLGIVFKIAEREPKQIREARKEKELEEFARREGLEI